MRGHNEIDKGAIRMKFSRWNEHGTKVEMEVHDDSTLDEILEEFQNFLRACGYTIEYNKVLDIVDMDA
jgi:hypothetical protein